MCGSSTPPTGTSAGPSTGWTCSRRRPGSPTAWSRWSATSRSTSSWWRGTSTTGRCPRWTWSRCSTTCSPGWSPPGSRSCWPAATTTPRAGSGSAPGCSTAAGVHLRTDPARVAEPVLLEDRHGPVAIYPLPYLEPALVAPGWSVAPAHEPVLTAADGPGPGRPGDPAGRHPQRARRARVRGRRAALGQRAGHRGRRGQRGPGRDLRPAGLRRPGPPARPAAALRPGPVQRVAAAVLVLRDRAGQGLLAGRAGRRRAAPGGPGGRPGVPAAGPALRPAGGPAHRRRRTRPPSRPGAR